MPKIFSTYLAYVWDFLDEFSDILTEDYHFDNVIHSGSCCCQYAPYVLINLPDLSHNVALADNIAVFVPGNLSSEVNCVAHLDRLSVAILLSGVEHICRG